MSGRHIDGDVALAMQLRTELVDVALAQAKEQNLHEAYFKAFEAMRTSRIYVWEPPAIEAFWRFWEHPRNYDRFMEEFFEHDALVYRHDLVTREFHMFPAPGRLFGEELSPQEYRDEAASIIFPPTTRAIGVTHCTVAGTPRIPAIIQSIEIDPSKLMPIGSGIMRLDRLPALPPHGTIESSRLVVHCETRFPRILGDSVVDRKPITWLICLYQLQIFLLQPFVGHTRKVHRGPKKGARDLQPAPEIVQVLMREPLPVRIPKYVFLAVHPVTGRKLEFEVDVRGHERHCASGVIAQVKPHKRGPTGKTREKVIKVIR